MPKTPFLHLLPPRIAAAARRLQAAIWQPEALPLSVLAAEPTAHHTPFHQKPTHFAPISPGTFWGPLFAQRWFRIEPPPGGWPADTFLEWRDHGEATFYSAEGLPLGGSDPAHLFCRLPEPLHGPVFAESLCLRSGIQAADPLPPMDERGSHFQGAFLRRRNDAAWHAWLDFQVLWELAIELARQERSLRSPETFASPLYLREEWPSLHPMLRVLVDALDRAVDALDLRGPAAVSETLAPIYRRLRGGLPGLAATATGHAHIDLVWLWPERASQAKAIHSLANALALMGRYPEFHFAYSQPASYRAVACRAPKLAEAIARRIAEGRWEAVGAMEVEADCLMPCGEALARNLFLGQREFERLTGQPSPVLWLPDCFGFPACLPQLCAQAGVRYFYTTKLSWSSATRFPFTSFRWRSHDGSEVLAHILNSEQNYNTAGTVEDLLRPWRVHQQAPTHPEVLIPLGYGDGGGGPTEEMCERLRRCAALWSIPETRWGRIADFFRRMESSAPELPVWEGEMLLEFHRGTLTTHAAIKQTYRALERALQTLEAALVLTGSGPAAGTFWQPFFMAQFHDDLPGSSIIEVVEEGLAARRRLLTEIKNLTCNVLGAAPPDTPAPPSSHPFLFNPLPLPATWLCGETNRLLSLPPLALLPESNATPVPPEQSPHLHRLTLTSPRCHAVFLPDGTLSALTFDHRDLPLAEGFGRLALYPDHPAIFEAWDIDRNSVGTPLPPAAKPVLTHSHAAPGRASLTFEQQLTRASTARITWSLEAHHPALLLDIELEWHDDALLLRLELPTRFRASHARFGAPFGSVLRRQIPGPLAHDARFETPASRWALLGDDSELHALALLTADRYGFGCSDGLLHCTLLRSAKITDSGKLQALRSCHYPHSFSDHGHHHFRLALAWGGLLAPLEEQPAALAERLFTTPLRVHLPAAEPRTLLPAGLPALRSNPPTLLPAWIKPAENGPGFLLRCHETRGQRGTYVLPASPASRWSLSNLQEDLTEPLPAGQPLPFSPYQLLSLRWLPEA